MNRLQIAVLPPILLLLLCTLPPAAAEDVSEDAEFGSALVDEGYTDLGVTYLEKQIDKTTAPAAKRQICAILAGGYDDLAQSATLPDDLRTKYEQSATKYWDLLLASQPAVPQTIEGCSDISILAGRIEPRLPRQKDTTRAANLRNYAGRCFALAVTGLEKKLADIEKTMDDSLPPEQQQAMQGNYLDCALKLCFARYRYASFLPAADPKRAPLIDETQKLLRYLIYAFSDWPYTIYAYELRAQIWLEVANFDDAVSTAQAGRDRIQAFLDDDPELASMLRPHADNLLALWIIATAGKGDFKKIAEEANGNTSIKVQAALAEARLIEAKANANNPAVMAAAKKRAEQILESLDKTTEGHREAARLRAKYIDIFGGAEYTKAFIIWSDAVRARNYAAMIPAGDNLLRFPEVKAVQRNEILNALAFAFVQQKQFIEPYIIFRSLSEEQEQNQELSDTLARKAVTCLRQLAGTTNAPIDRSMLDNAEKWLRDNHGGADKEYDDAVAAKQKGDLAAALDMFLKVPAASTYHEPCLVQIADCHITLAGKTLAADPAAAEKHLAEARQFLAQFDKESKVPTDIPRLRNLRSNSRAFALYLLTRLDLWNGKPDYTACLARTENLIENYPNAPRFYPFLFFQRIQAQIGLQKPDAAQTELTQLETTASALPDEDAAAWITSGVTSVFHAYRDEAARLTAANKPELAAQATDKALNLIYNAILKNNSSPFEFFTFAIDSLDKAKRYNELIQAGQILENQYGGKKTDLLKPDQIEQMKYLNLLRGKALYYNGQPAEAIPFLKTYIASATQEDLYSLTAKLFLAKSLKETISTNPAAGEDAMKLLNELRDRLTTQLNKPDLAAIWWDANATSLEVRNALKQFGDTLYWIRLTLAAYPALGSPDIRQRYVAVLEHLYRNSTVPDEQSKALDFIITIRQAEIALLLQQADAAKGAAKNAKLREAFNIIKDFAFFDSAYGGEKGQKIFRDLLDQIRQKTDNPDLMKEVIAIKEKIHS